MHRTQGAQLRKHRTQGTQRTQLRTHRTQGTQIQRRLCQDAMAPYLTQGNFLLMLLGAKVSARGGPTPV